MSGDDTSRRGRSAEVIRIDAERLRSSDQSRHARADQGYPPYWKAISREILLTYREMTPLRLGGKPLGATRLRNLIMADHDKASGETDRRLSRDHLQDWFSGKAVLGDVAFSFVDDFVRKLQLDDPCYDEMKRAVKDKIDLFYRVALKELYSTRSVMEDGTVNAHLCDLAGLTFISPTVSSWEFSAGGVESLPPPSFKQTAMYFHTFRAGMLGVRVIYSRVPLSGLGRAADITRQIVTVYNGYLVPRSFEASHNSLYGTILLYRREVNGIERLVPYTASDFSYATGSKDKPGRVLRTGWSGQVMYPSSFHEVAARHQPKHLPNTNTIADDEAERPMISPNVLFDFLEINTFLEPIHRYLENLTEDYLIW